jgi:hypothetical protein
MAVGTLLANAFTEARLRHQKTYEEWVRISFKVGALLPASLLPVSIQRDGELDLVVRCLEDEIANTLATGKSDDNFVGHHLNSMSTYWIGGVYETCRLLRARNLVDQNEKFVTLVRDLELVRIPLEKHEIARDNKVKEPLRLVRHPIGNESRDEHIYARDDAKRSHIMPMGLSARGSMTWQVLDVRDGTSRWVERRTLSDQMLDLWAKT